MCAGGVDVMKRGLPSRCHVLGREEIGGGCGLCGGLESAHVKMQDTTCPFYESRPAGRRRARESTHEACTPNITVS